MFSRRTTLAGLATLVAAGVAVPLVLAPSAHGKAKPAVKPTIVLVHGAFADASSWDGVVQRLQADGYPVKAPAVPLRDLAGDSAYVNGVLANTPGPVILVGHSYGGSVITSAGNNAPNVKALVYIAAYAPDQGESVVSLSQHQVAHPVSPLPVVKEPYSQPNGQTGFDLYIDSAKLRQVFLSNTVSSQQAAILAATQRPVTVAALNGATNTPAWKTLPSWYMVAKNDNTIGADLERFMANRIGAHTVEVSTSHVVMLNDPAGVTHLIEQAAVTTVH